MRSTSVSDISGFPSGVFPALTPPVRISLNSRRSIKLLARFSESFRRREHGVHVARDLHLAPDLADYTFAVDEKGGPGHAHILPSVHTFLDPDAVGPSHSRFRVRSQQKLQLVLQLELVVRSGTVF